MRTFIVKRGPKTLPFSSSPSYPNFTNLVYINNFLKVLNKIKEVKPIVLDSRTFNFYIMASYCIQSCVNDSRAPVRATYVNLYKWPESDAEFIKSLRSNIQKGSIEKNHHGLPSARVVDSVSCRQIYLRSYTFSTEEKVKNIEAKTKCIGRAKKTQGGRAGEERRKVRSCGSGGGKGGGGKRRKCWRLSKVKELSCNVMGSIFRRLLYCTTEVDVVN